MINELLKFIDKKIESNPDLVTISSDEIIRKIYCNKIQLENTITKGKKFKEIIKNNYKGYNVSYDTELNITLKKITH